jgi:hypothetical protein
VGTKRINSVFISAQILSMEPLQTGWPCVVGELELTIHHSIQFYARGKPLGVLQEKFKVGDFVEVKGHLSKAPNGTLQITVTNIQPQRMEAPITVTHRMQIPQLDAAR